MQIQSFSPLRTAPARTSAPAPEKTAPEPEDRADVGGWKEAAVAVGRSGLRGAIEGVGWSYMAFLAQAAGGPTVGLAARVAILGVGAAVGVKEDSGKFEQITGSPTLGKVMAGVAGAGRHLLYIGTNPATSMEGAVLNGAAMGGLLGVLNTPR